MYSYSGVMQCCGAQSTKDVITLNFALNLSTAASSGLNITGLSIKQFTGSFMAWITMAEH